MSITTILARTAKLFSEKTAIEFEEQQITFAELSDRATHIANHFSSLGISKGDRIAHFTPTSLELIYSLLATFRNRSIVVPVNHHFKELELLHILSDSEAKAIITDEERLPLVKKIQSQLPELKEIILIHDLADFRHHTDIESFSGEEEIAAIFYTSGTTGKPKGAALSNRNIISNLEVLQKAWHWTSNDILLHALPLYHVHGFAIALCGSLLAGNTIILRKKFDAQDVLETIHCKRTSLFMGVPTMYFKLIEEKNPEHDLSSMRLFISGSAPLSKELFHRFEQKFGFEILERAGMSETMMNFSNPIDGKRIPGSVGFPLPGVQVRIVNEDFVDQPENTEGEILLKGENIFQGYWNSPEANEKSFRDGWFITGDIGKIDSEGYVYIVGRKKDVIKSGGLLIYPKEVEEVIISIPQVKECAVIGIPDEKYGESVKACVVLNSGSICSEEIISYCKSRMASFKKPRLVEFFDSLPRNTMGKVLKEELRKMHSDNEFIGHSG